MRSCFLFVRPQATITLGCTGGGLGSGLGGGGRAPRGLHGIPSAARADAVAASDASAGGARFVPAVEEGATRERRRAEVGIAGPREASLARLALRAPRSDARLVLLARRLAAHGRVAERLIFRAPRARGARAGDRALLRAAHSARAPAGRRAGHRALREESPPAHTASVVGRPRTGAGPQSAHSSAVGAPRRGSHREVAPSEGVVKLGSERMTAGAWAPFVARTRRWRRMRALGLGRSQTVRSQRPHVLGGAGAVPRAVLLVVVLLLMVMAPHVVFRARAEAQHDQSAGGEHDWVSPPAVRGREGWGGRRRRVRRANCAL